MDTVYSIYNVSDHVRYWLYHGGLGHVVVGRIQGLEETGHKTSAYRIERDHVLQDNVGMREIDVVSPINILGLVE